MAIWLTAMLIQRKLALTMWKIIAYDANGNKTEKEYAVAVKEKPEEPKPSNNQTQQQTPQTIYTPPITSQNQGSTKPSTNNKPSNNQQTQTCVANGQWKSLGNSGYAGYDYDEVFQWGEEHCPENHGYAVGTVHDICGKQGWSVEFFELHEN